MPIFNLKILSGGNSSSCKLYKSTPGKTTSAWQWLGEPDICAHTIGPYSNKAFYMLVYTWESWLLTEKYDGFYTLNYSAALFTDGAGTHALIQMACKGGNFHNYILLISSVSLNAVFAIWDQHFQWVFVPAYDMKACKL